MSDEYIKVVATSMDKVAFSDISELCKQRPMESITYSENGELYSITVTGKQVFVVGAGMFGLCRYFEHTPKRDTVDTVEYATREEFFKAVRIALPRNWKKSLKVTVLR